LKTDNFLVVLGLNSEKKPHAARFDLVDEAAVRKAAAHKNFQIGHAKTKEAAELANKLIDGRIFDSGRGLVPFVSVEVFEKLKKVLEIEDAMPATLAATAAMLGKGDVAAALPSKSTDLWTAIKVGNVVLVQRILKLQGSASPKSS
jgi:hypothetical protein